jgi:hypothetical protein
MSYPGTAEFDRQMKRLFDEVDDYLEDTYGGDFPLHPARAERGETVNKEHSGLFNVGASFTAGFGSDYGRGYVIQVDMVTLADVEPEREEHILRDAARKAEALLPEYFPDRALHVDRDGRVFKIHGDISLGTLH